MEDIHMSLKVWLCDLCYTQQLISSDVIPAQIGGIATYCESHMTPPPKFRLFKYPEELIKAFHTEQPHVIGFSNYLWNLELSYGFANTIKKKFPNIVVVMGGPNFPLSQEHQKSFLQSRPAIDYYIEKEGELAFYNLLQSLIHHEFDIDLVKKIKLGNVRGITKDGEFCAGSVLGRISDLSEIPSPYLMGKLDDFFDGKLTPILHTTRGCPFTCTYCVESTIYYAKKFRKPDNTLKAEIDFIGQKMKGVRDTGGRNDLHIADSNFGMYKEDIQTAYWIADAQRKYDWPEYIVCSTGKNKHDRIMKVSSIVNGKIRVSGSVQSTDKEILKNIKRANIDMKQLFRLADEANKVGAESHSEVILGLPEDTVQRHLNSIGELIDAGFTNIRMYQLILLMGTPLYSQYREKKFACGTHFRIVPFDYGDYAFDDDTNIVSAAIEEVVTSLDGLSYENYLQCRTFNLMVDTFYNQGVFQGIIKLLKQLNISRYAWIKKIWESEKLTKISEIIDQFIQETKDELWDSYDELMRYTSEPDTIKKYLSGELGAKLIFKYKSILTQEYLYELAEITRHTVLQLIDEVLKSDSKIEPLIDDILSYEILRKINLFKGDYEPKYCMLDYDVKSFLESKEDIPISKLVFTKSKKCKFFLNQNQIDIIERNLNTYGRDLTAMTKIVSFVHIESVYRHVEFVG
jgi:radical SAM superfamily enzyme YgiQ (UPF0313 family)